MLSESLSARRLTTLALTLFFVVGVVGLAPRPGIAADPPDRDEQLRFMWAMAGQESGWDYYARNSASGAFGKYQIMPFNWPVWAAYAPVYLIGVTGAYWVIERVGSMTAPIWATPSTRRAFTCMAASKASAPTASRRKCARSTRPRCMTC